MKIRRIKQWFDGSAIAIGLLTMALFFCAPQDKYHALSNGLCLLCGLMGLIYIVYAIFLWCTRRIDFDWHLINGHFLRKVVCLVLLMPFTLTIFMMGVNRICLLGESPKELVFDDKIYAPGDNHLNNIGAHQKESPTLFWGVYYHFIDAGNQHMTSTKIGRAYAALFAVLGVVLLNGLLISSIIGWVDRRKERWQNGEIRYSLRHLKKNGFAVVIGSNEVVSSVLKNLLKGKGKDGINFKSEGYNRYVILQTSRDVQKVRGELSSHLTQEELQRVILYQASRDSKMEIPTLFVQYATEIYVLGESTLANGGEAYHDTMNMKCVNLLAACLEAIGNQEKRVCKVMFEYQTTYSVFQFSDISDVVKKHLVFIPFNRYESWARKVIVDGVYEFEDSRKESITYTPLDGTGLDENTDEFVHFVIVGMSKMGIAMGVQCLLQAHYMNYQKAKTRITFIDANADKEMNFFKGRYANLFELVCCRYLDLSDVSALQLEEPWMDPMGKSGNKWTHLSDNGQNFLDMEIEFVRGELESEGVREYLKHISDNPRAKLTFAICLTKAHQAVAASLYMPIEVYKNSRLQEIWVYQRESADIIANLNNDNNKDLRYRKLRPFGMLFGEYMTDRTLYLKGMLINVAYDIANGYNQEGWPKTFADKNDKGYVRARKSWKKLSVDKKWSNKYFADSMYIKIRSLLMEHTGYASMLQVRDLLMKDKIGTMDIIRNAFKDNEEVMARTEHNRWTAQQIMMGYSPCDKVLDRIFRQRNLEGESEDVIMAYLAWKQENLGESTCCKKIKDDVKECALRIHPNICDYNHLNVVDSGAQQYDKDLNNAIAIILSLVDGYVET